MDAPMAQWIRRLPTEQEISGSNPDGRSVAWCSWLSRLLYTQEIASSSLAVTKN